MCSSDSLKKYARTVAIGKAYGYPRCCIDEFIKLVAKGVSPAAEMMRDPNMKGNNTGFVPCSSCRSMLSDYDLDLKDLFHKRKAGVDYSEDMTEELEVFIEFYYNKEIKRINNLYNKSLEPAY